MSNTTEPIRIAVAEASAILRSGVTSVLKRLSNLKVQPIEVHTLDALKDCIQAHCPDILIINPNFCGYFDLAGFKESENCSALKCISLITGIMDPSLLAQYDDTISIFDDMEIIATKISALQDIGPEKESEEQEALSSREKEIVVCIVKGMTNKEIAETLFLSIHTVITHRRNITRKLQIHSSAGLTIYAIVNKLIDIKEVK